MHAEYLLAGYLATYYHLGPLKHPSFFVFEEQKRDFQLFYKTQQHGKHVRCKQGTSLSSHGSVKALHSAYFPGAV